jgi:hypothetical protein
VTARARLESPRFLAGSGVARNLKCVIHMTLLELIVALSLPVWLAVEELLRLRSRRERMRLVRRPRLSRRRAEVVLSRTASLLDDRGVRADHRVTLPSRSES